MIKEVRDFLIPIGGTMGDLIDSSPRETISRVFLEDKLFDTWHDGRTVLIGDGMCFLAIWFFLLHVVCILNAAPKLCVFVLNVLTLTLSLSLFCHCTR